MMKDIVIANFEARSATFDSTYNAFLLNLASTRIMTLITTFETNVTKTRFTIATVVTEGSTGTLDPNGIVTLTFQLGLHGYPS